MFSQFMQQAQPQQLQGFAGANPMQAFLASIMFGQQQQRPMSWLDIVRGRRQQQIDPMYSFGGYGADGGRFGQEPNNLDSSNSVAGLGMSPMGRAALGMAFGPVGGIASALGGMARGYNGYGELGNGGLGVGSEASGPGTIGSRDSYGSNQSQF